MCVCHVVMSSFNLSASCAYGQLLLNGQPLTELSGPRATIEAALSNITYIPLNDSFTGNDTVTLSVVRRNVVGQSATTAVLIRVSPIPTVQVPPPLFTAEDTALTISGVNITAGQGGTCPSRCPPGATWVTVMIGGTGV